jgi:arylsulfatase A-like enzyme
MRLIVFTVPVLLALAVSLRTLAEQPPNIVLIISDDQSWNDYGFMGHPQVETPHLDKLAGESLLFTRGYVPTSLCCPSLASIITGLYPHQHKITGNEPPRPKGGKGNPYQTSDSFRADVETMISYIDIVPTLPGLLGEKGGYVSHQSGKWWQGNYMRGGFTAGMTQGFPNPGGRHGDKGLEIGRKGLKPIEEFIDSAGEKPFFLWYAPFLPHTPHNPPKRLFEKYLKLTDSSHIARYWAMCEWFDETCGELLGVLNTKGHADNTIVIYVTDNGWIQSPNAGRYDLRSKRSQYDGGIRTPIMVRWPGKVKPERSEIPVSSLDLAPTVLKACGLSVPENLPGIDLLDRDALNERKSLFGDCHLHNAVDVRAPGKNLTYRWCLHGGWKLILPHQENVTKRAGRGASGTGEIELFRIQEDPWESKNLAGNHPEVVEQLTKLINDWWKPDE